MIRNEEARKPLSFTDRRAHVAADDAWGPAEPRTLVIRHGSGWQSLAVLFLCLLIGAVVLLGHWVVRGLDRKDQETTAAMVRAERKIQQLESGFTFEARRRQMLLGMRNHILKANPRVSLADAYRYAELALAACEKYPAVDPLLLLAIGIVESGYDPQARSPADARGLYQIWPSTGRLLAHALGWTYDDTLLFDPEKNTQAAALYLDVLFSTYRDPQMVLAEYNGGPLNAGYLRAGAAALARETRSYVPRVLDLHQRLKQEFDEGTALALQAEGGEGSARRGKTLGSP
ncbi:MAG TPA: transglycosylase SLT domain-containing protein [Vicinamibacteria bacterium]|nr:transglycosylase SLT domain-containing protein [Vicinamibacteria bacterium]